MHRQERWSVLVLHLLFLPAILLSAAWTQDRTTSSAYNTIEGTKIFQYRCAMCHGFDGRGHGPDSVVLKHPTPDLTLISQRGGGKFPYQRVRDIIDGRKLDCSPKVIERCQSGGRSSMRLNLTKTGERYD